MNLTLWNQRPHQGMFRDLNRFFEEPLWNLPATLETERVEFFPKVDMIVKDQNILVTTELPGMTEKDIDLTIAEETLTIRGEKKEEHEEKKVNYYKMERSYGAFARTVELPCAVDREKAHAEFKKGVLTITLPKAKEVKAAERKVPIVAV